jgi:hypothetical protein
VRVQGGGGECCDDGSDTRWWPPWLRPLLSVCFFVQCRVHTDAHKSECNMYCLDCMGDALCALCLAARHRDHHSIQVSGEPSAVRRLVQFGSSGGCVLVPQCLCLQHISFPSNPSPVPSVSLMGISGESTGRSGSPKQSILGTTTYGKKTSALMHAFSVYMFDFYIEFWVSHFSAISTLM